MKTGRIVSGIVAAAGVVCTGSILSGAGVRHNKMKKQKIQLEKELKYLWVKGTESLNLKAQYEKAYLQTMISMKNAKHESIKTLSIAAK